MPPVWTKCTITWRHQRIARWSMKEQFVCLFHFYFILVVIDLIDDDMSCSVNVFNSELYFCLVKTSL